VKSIQNVKDLYCYGSIYALKHFFFLNPELYCILWTSCATMQKKKLSY